MDNREKGNKIESNERGSIFNAKAFRRIKFDSESNLRANRLI